MEIKSQILLLLLVALLQESIGSIEPPKVQEVSRNDTKISEHVYKKVYDFMKYSKVFRNYTFEDAKKFMDELQDWKAPDDLAKRFPYYLAGYDYDDRPIWVAEVGKYNITGLLKQGPSIYPVFEKMGLQLNLRVMQSMAGKDGPGKDIRQIVVLLDYEGFDMKQLNEVLEHKEAIYFAVEKSLEYGDLSQLLIAQIVIINARFVPQMVIDFWRQIAGELMERVVVIGVNKYKWKAELRRVLPEEALPPWYGGSANYKPLAVYG